MIVEDDHDHGPKEITIAETSAWFQLQKYKPNSDDYYWNENVPDDVDKNIAVSMTVPRPSMELHSN